MLVSCALLVDAIFWTMERATMILPPKPLTIGRWDFRAFVYYLVDTRKNTREITIDFALVNAAGSVSRISYYHRLCPVVRVFVVYSRQTSHINTSLCERNPPQYLTVLTFKSWKAIPNEYLSYNSERWNTWSVEAMKTIAKYDKDGELSLMRLLFVICRTHIAPHI